MKNYILKWSTWVNVHVIFIFDHQLSKYKVCVCVYVCAPGGNVHHLSHLLAIAPLPRMRSAALHHFQYPSVGEPAEAEN